MHDKTKALLIAALLLPAMAVAGNENDASQNKQLQIEQIQEETALYEAMLAREKIRHELRTLEQGISPVSGSVTGPGKTSCIFFSFTVSTAIKDMTMNRTA